ncbi:alanine racemase [Fodinibius sediminis]|uniref:D-serine deaminase, pyridoxal phosphate-dependent n=1 Tax=Fodinibius sediminis TaxID=1214077 RepID=A0A521AZ84_9BACT|nr:alanine racemase [Fodinibius sediminis]SMO40115.1 D-serine deaminase, pyridoxal phosphate-dependent [Fodinibius sediminis]
MHSVSEPTLLLNETICQANIERMAHKAATRGLQFKPHMKTHQSAVIGQWLRSYGVTAVTVSSVSMASYFARHDWEDITIAFPCNLRETERINALAEKISLTLLVNRMETADTLQQQLSHQVDVYIELDTGAGRTGLQPSQTSYIIRLINCFKQADKLNWKGFYSHPGHSYTARSEAEIQSIHQTVLTQINRLRSKLGTSHGPFEVCIGDTPCASKGTEFNGIDAISPGNFVFYDLMQVQIGSCAVSDIATAVCCPVVDRYPNRNQLAIYGGAIHFSKEPLSEDDEVHFGLAATKQGHAWNPIDDHTHLTRLSQEHGIVQCSPRSFEQFSVGDTITILPVHSCLTAHLLGRFVSTGGTTIHQAQLKDRI